MFSKYTLNNTSRIGDDECDKSQENIQNSNYSQYMLTNYSPECPISNAIDFATSQLNVNYKGSHQVGLGGCNIDDNSDLLLNDITRSPCRISLFQRPFATVPYLGRGKSNPLLEAQLQQGDQNLNKKSINPSSEICYMKYSNTPLLQPLKETIANPNNLIEDNAAKGWIRGGVPSRELTRGKDYDNSIRN